MIFSDFHLPVVHLLQSSVLTDRIFFPALALSPEVNSSHSLSEDFLPGALECVTVSSFLSTALASSEAQNHQPPSPFLLPSQTLPNGSPAELRSLSFGHPSCLFLTGASLNPGMCGAHGRQKEKDLMVSIKLSFASGL